MNNTYNTKIRYLFVTITDAAQPSQSGAMSVTLPRVTCTSGEGWKSRRFSRRLRSHHS